MQKQIDDKNAQIEQYSKGTEHLANLQDELETLRVRRNSINEVLKATGENKELSKRLNKINKDILKTENAIQAIKNPQAAQTSQTTTAASQTENVSEVTTPEEILNREINYDESTDQFADVSKTITPAPPQEKVQAAPKGKNTSQPKKQSAKDAVKQQLMQQANEAAHRLNMETIAKADKAAKAKKRNS